MIALSVLSEQHIQLLSQLQVLYIFLLQRLANVDMPGDAQRIHSVTVLLTAGYARQVLVSQAIHTKHRLVSH